MQLRHAVPSQPGGYYAVRESYGYDGAGRLVSIDEASGGSIGEADFAAVYYHPSFLPAITAAPGRLSSFTYDRLGRQLTQSDMP